MRRFSLLVVAVAMIVTVGVGASPASAQGGGTYIVQPGDTLFSIAARFNVSVSELATINGVYDIHAVFVGQVLRLPPSLPGAAPSSPVVSPPTVPVRPISPYPPGTTVTTVTSYSAYTVRRGDSLGNIAARFGTTIHAILSANAIANPNLIYIGQYLIIPRTRTTVVPAPRPTTTVPTVRGTRYIVQPGDTLFLIAQRFRRNAWDIARANGILNLNRIYVGQVLTIP